MRSGARSARGKKNAEVHAVMEELADELQRVAEGPAGPAVRCAALEALLWFQVRCSARRRQGLGLLGLYGLEALQS